MLNFLVFLKKVMTEEKSNYFKGRGAQINTGNKFQAQQIVREEVTGIDDWEVAVAKTQFIDIQAKTIVNKVTSPDVGMMYSMNPYQGCEHGCIYCYARNSFEYWGYSAGIDFEQKILVKKDAPDLLRKFLMRPQWTCEPISLSGNTDCYQPAERKFELTRQMLQICNSFNQPVGLISKNALMLRDKDILQEMASKNLVSALISITSMDNDLRSLMEPRTATAKQRFKVIEELSNAGVRMGVMLGPMIPGLNDHEMHNIIKSASDAGAVFSAYTFIRLNGAIKTLFHDWLYKNFPDRADKVWHLIENSHDGQVNDSRYGVRMRGEGAIAELIAQQYKKYTKMYGLNQDRWQINTQSFMRPGQQLSMW